MDHARAVWVKAILLAAIVFATAQPGWADARKTVVVLGDSLAAGLGVEAGQAYPAVLQEKIKSAGLPFTIVDAGVSGDTTADGLSRLNWLLQRKIDVLVVELGGNDGLRGIPIATIQSNLQAIVERAKARYPDIKIVIAGMRMPANMGPDYVEAFAKVFSDVATKNHAALVPFLLEGVGGDPRLNQADGIHPTAEGHKIVAENVWKTLRPVLESEK
ncbi:MAG TPA: arylesterase [Verrucomicrobiae bacterium]|jgi:acyl-CoA thioesterase-1